LLIDPPKLNGKPAGVLVEIPFDLTQSSTHTDSYEPADSN